ncbi:MAG TPA: shikimate kinase [Pusillimonas sp.]|uniref:shikimate kinase n=1 Tax=Pusillimonas sp. TaxID=3040095 RepID=UPI002B4B011E|nr:shikimate kinase [Pusillimonas sp.]HLU20533.1 shikimate kinase [Pusillimonas sp.]
MTDSLRANTASQEGRLRNAQAEPAPADTDDRPIVLVGMMGAGKTTIGRHLAKALNREFVDLDLALEARCGVPVAVIFEIEGEAGFRKRETQLLDHYSQQKGIVLATGGGAVLAEVNRAMLKQRGLVVYLRANSDELYQRVARDRQRPLLQTDNPRARVAELLTQRAPLYEEVATLTFDTGSTPIPQAVQQLVSLLKQTRIRDEHRTS